MLLAQGARSVAEDRLKALIATIGPALLEDGLLQRIHRAHYIYRINGVHGSLEDVSALLRRTRVLVPDAMILLDLPGSKVRTTELPKPIFHDAGEVFELSSDQIDYPGFHRHLERGDVLWANDSTQRFQVVGFRNDTILLQATYSGYLYGRKGLHVRNKDLGLPFLSERDRALIDLANRNGVQFVGLSFVRRAHDVREARSLVSPSADLMVKIETRQALENIDSILALSEVEYVLLDRGDLAADIGIERIPSAQRHVVEKVHAHEQNLLMATQFLKYMETNPIPTIAEMNDLYNTLRLGVFGIQLSEETAVGHFPAECLNVVNSISDHVLNETTGRDRDLPN
jgi:pyruvate kinase